MKLKLTDSDKISSSPYYRIFLYGDNRTGKTHFSATWPNPVYLVPEIALNEMRTLQGMKIPVVPFSTIDSCQEQVIALCEQINRKKKIGNYIPKTIVVDNLTSAFQVWKNELMPSLKTKLGYDEWSKIASTLNAMMVTLHSMDTHVIWIAHSKVGTIKTKDERNRIVETNIGRYTLDGQAKHILPSHCDLLYTESTSTIKGVQYWIHTQKCDIWPAGFRTGSGKTKLPRRVGPDPHYDDFAPALGLPILEVAEKQ